MILVLDTSASMGQRTDSGSTRLDVMKNAAKAVLDTLTKYDYATVIEFNSEAESHSSTLVSVTDENRCYLDNFIDDLNGFGNTNYEKAFKLAYEVMSDSIEQEMYSSCSAQIILFLTDGSNKQGRQDIQSYIK